MVLFGSLTMVFAHLFNSAEALSDGLYYADKFDCFGYVSNHKHRLKGKYRRTQEGEIHYLDIPTRFDKIALMERLTAMRVRGEDKSPRKMHPNSLANLRPARPFTPTDRPNNPRKVTPQAREQVIQLREDGYSWRVIGDKVGLNVSTVREGARRG